MSRSVFNNTHLRTTLQVSQRLGVCLRTVQLWCNAGTLPCQVTPGRHRRVHIAHIALLEFRMNNQLAMPNRSEFAEALRVWQASQGLLDPAVNTRASARLAFDPSMWLKAHQEARAKAGKDAMPTDRLGNLAEHLDVISHAGFVAGMQFALSYLGASAPQQGGTPEADV